MMKLSKYEKETSLTGTKRKAPPASIPSMLI